MTFLSYTKTHFKKFIKPKVTSILSEDILALCRHRKIIVQLITFLTLLVVQLSSQKKFLLTKEGEN